MCSRGRFITAALVRIIILGLREEGSEGLRTLLVHHLAACEHKRSETEPETDKYSTKLDQREPHSYDELVSLSYLRKRYSSGPFQIDSYTSLRVHLASTPPSIARACAFGKAKRRAAEMGCTISAVRFAEAQLEP